MFRVLGVLIPFLLLTHPASAATSAASQSPLSRVRVSPDGHGFVTESGKPFVPFGLTYFRANTGWAP